MVQALIGLRSAAARRRDRRARGRDHARPRGAPSAAKRVSAACRGRGGRRDRAARRRARSSAIRRASSSTAAASATTSSCSAYTLAALPADGERVTLRVFTHATREQDRAVRLHRRAGARAVRSADHGEERRAVDGDRDPVGLEPARHRDADRARGRRRADADQGRRQEDRRAARRRAAREVRRAAARAGTPTAALRPAATVGAIAPAKRDARHPMLDEVAGALVGMGWRPAEAEARGRRARGRRPSATIEELLRQALRSMPR